MSKRKEEGGIHRVGFAEKLGFGTFSTASNVVFTFKTNFSCFLVYPPSLGVFKC